MKTSIGSKTWKFWTPKPTFSVFGLTPTSEKKTKQKNSFFNSGNACNPFILFCICGVSKELSWSVFFLPSTFFSSLIYFVLCLHISLMKPINFCWFHKNIILFHKDTLLKGWKKYFDSEIQILCRFKSQHLFSVLK